MATTQEEIAREEELTSINRRLLGITPGYIPATMRVLLTQRRDELMQQKLAAEEAGARKEAPPPIHRVALTPSEAKARIKEIVAKPEYWDPSRRDSAGRPVISKEDHARLLQETRELHDYYDRDVDRARAHGMELEPETGLPARDGHGRFKRPAEGGEGEPARDTGDRFARTYDLKK